MKKLNRRAFSVLLIAFFILTGLFTYIQRFLEDGERWASYFSRLNSLSEGVVTDRNGVLLAGSRIVYNVTLSRSDLVRSGATNRNLRELVHAADEFGVSYTDTFPVSAAAPYEYVSLAVSPRYAPEEADGLIPVFKEYMRL